MDKLLLGVAREIITPEIGCQLYGYAPDVFSTTVEDDLTATAFYFKQGETEILMVSIEVCLINTELTNEILEKISQKTGVKKSNILISATHTHSGPNTGGAYGWGDIDRKYCEGIFVPQIVSACVKAKGDVKEATMHSTRGQSLVGINRRQLSQKGNSVFLGQNPWGPYNPYMTVISFKDNNGKCVANMIHYGCHGTAAGRNTEISRDWSGLMIDALEEATGGITAFFNGPEGDVGPRLSNGKTTGDISYVRELGKVAADDVLRIYNSGLKQQEAVISADTFETPIPYKERKSEADARAMIEKLKDHTVNSMGYVRRQSELTVEAYEKGLPNETEFKFPQTLVRLGEFVFTSFPFELFSEIGMRIDTFFPDKSVLSLSNANGSEGYFATEDAICRGGYEITMFTYGHIQSFAENADFALIKATVDNINKLLEEN